MSESDYLVGLGSGFLFFSRIIMHVKYDIAISFAGENREIAENIAKELRSKGISVFYDDYEKVDLWGKDLYEHLISIYRDNSKYCLMLISDYYIKKLWTSHERKAAQARAFKENREYILPVRLDDTEVTSVLETTGHLDFRKETIHSICNAIEKKLWGDFQNDQGIQLLKNKLEAIYNRTMLICDLVLMPSNHINFGKPNLSTQLYPPLVKLFSDSKSQALLTAATFDKMILADLSVFFDNIEKIIKIISFLMCRFNFNKSAYDFIMEIPEQELDEAHNFLKKLNLFDSYGVRNQRYYTPNEIIDNWRAAERENNNIYFSPSDYVFTDHRRAFAFNFNLLSKIHAKVDCIIETFTD